jgi:hypothetical protein
LPSVIDADDIATLSPDVIATELSTILDAEVPTVNPDIIKVVPSDLYRLAVAAVPVATAVPLVIAFNVSVPLLVLMLTHKLM